MLKNTLIMNFYPLSQRKVINISFGFYHSMIKYDLENLS